MKVKLLFIFALLLTAVTGAFADNSGSCGTDVSYSYVESTHTLTISGTGAMTDYNYPSEQPWYSYATEIETVIIKDGVTGIGNCAFLNCTGLTTVTIGTGVTYIGIDAFCNCTNVTDVYCNADPEKLTWDESNCDDFKPDGTTIIHVADAAPWYTKFGGEVNGTFIDKPYVPLSWNYDAATKTLTFSGTVIPSYVDLDECPWIDYVEEVENIVIEDDVTRIGNHAFEHYKSLTTVTIGSGVTYIGRDAFFNCTNVEVVYCNADPLKLTWDENDCNDFKSDGSTVIQVADAAPWIEKFTGVVNGTFSDKPYVPLTWNYDADTNTLTLSGTVIPSYDDPEERPWKDYFAEVENIVIEDDVTRIGDYAFEGCTGLTTVTIPASVTSIGNHAFYYCTGLTTVTIGSGVTYIGYDAFFHCTAVTDVYCYADPTKLTWDEGECDDFMYDGSTKTKCHVTDATKFEEKWSTGDPEVDVNVDFDGDLAPKAETNAAGEEYWSSYYNSAVHLKADDNTTVYKATLSGTTVTLTEITDKVITAGQAVLLKKTTTDAVELTPWAAASTDDYSGNDLEGVDVETAKESSSDYYVLSYQNAKLSFYKYSGATLGANKAFFKIPANSSRDFLDIVGDVTGIDVISKMSDGRSDVYYDLNGRRVMNPTKKGVYIVRSVEGRLQGKNGSKVVVK